MSDTRYVFLCQYNDVAASVIRDYQLTYFWEDNSIEMYCFKTKKPFLKRMPYPLIQESDLFIGGTITIYSRQLQIVDYADDFTRVNLDHKRSKACGFILPKGYNNMGQILALTSDTDLSIPQIQMVKFTEDQVKKILPDCDAKAIAADVVIVFELVGMNASGRWRQLVDQELGPQFPECLYAPKTQDEASKLLDHFFGPTATLYPTTAVFNNCTCCVVRPHAIKEAGAIIDRILKEGFEISAMKVWYLDRNSAEEFLEVYKGVVPEYQKLVEEMCAGPALVMEVRQEDVVNQLRQLVGPPDPEIAKHLRPNTLRAQFGIDKVKNAVHCTDLPEDGLLENKYFFEMLYAK